MAEPTNVIEAPSAPLTTRSGSAAPPSTGTINVVPQPAVAPEPPKAGSAKARMFEKLRSIAKDETGRVPAAAPAPVKPAPAPQTPEAPENPEAVSLGEDLDDETTNQPATPATPTETPKPDPTKQGKVSPWKLVDDYKERLKRHEVEMSELRKLIPNETEAKSRQEEFTRIQARNKELEEEIRYTNYSKSQEFVDKYQKPYEAAWQAAAQDLQQLTIATEDGTERQATPSDLLALVNLPLGQAMRAAQQAFGDLAPAVMNHRQKIADIFQAQQAALAEARKGGEERERQMSQKYQEQRETMQRDIVGHWEKYNAAIAKDPKFGKHFTPVEGDEVGNSKLEKGLRLVDQAMSMNPFDPRLTPEQRTEAVRRQAAVRQRAAAFSRLVHQLGQRDVRISELEAELKQYRGSTPEPGGSTTVNAPAPTSARASIFDALHRLAK